MNLNIKSIITASGLLTLYIITLAVVITMLVTIRDETILLKVFTIIFTLFTNVVTAVSTYFFTRKSADSEHKEKEEE
ncbi:MAG: hypothetical protein FWC79_06260 [Oscillospiraceae bacterium]|nr:hypothetical protein [Oscillospiraceae bacterium]